jgi:UDP-GlcNAc3NAcA epimerase
MIDVAFKWQSAAPANSEALAGFDIEPGSYLLLTAHRAGNVDDPERLQALVDVVAALPGRVIFPVHPRTRTRLRETGLLARLEAFEELTLYEPLGYVRFSALVQNARAVLTDSGGVQKEAYLAGVPCITLRRNTEWVETVQSGWNTLVDLDGERVLQALERPIPQNHPQLYGDGKAAERCVAAIGAL